MPKFVVSHKGKTVQIEKDVKDSPVIGKKIGETIPGDFLGLDGYELKVTGGSDKEGFPMASDIVSARRKRLLRVAGATGFRSNIHGLRRRKSVRGCIIESDIMQVNCTVVKEVSKNFESFIKKEEKAEG